MQDESPEADANRQGEARPFTLCPLIPMETRQMMQMRQTMQIALRRVPMPLSFDRAKSYYRELPTRWLP